MLDTIVSQSTREVSLSQVAFLLRTVLDTVVMTSTSSNATTSSFAKVSPGVHHSVFIILFYPFDFTHFRNLQMFQTV